jgi:hypothetical protein
MSKRGFRFHALSLCCAFFAAVLAPHVLCAEGPKTIPGEKVNRLVIASLSHQGVTKPKIVSHIDLTGPFATATQWTFVAVQDGGHAIPESEDYGPIFLCLVKATSPDCAFYQQADDMPHDLFAGSVVYASQNKSSPLLILKACGEAGPNGNCAIATVLYKYDKGTDCFLRMFQNLTGRNNNQDTRFVESGPLQGDVIANYPTENAPFTYWIEVYRAGDSGQFSQILRYRGHTHYSDGNPLAVADSEMPEILHRLGLWQSGDPLPVPAHLPQGCRHLFMRRGEEWCK